MSKVDWGLAPEGATHFGPANENWRACWHKWSNGELLGWLADGDKNWTRTTAAMGSNDRLSSLIERPQPKPWSGPEDGLPPIGWLVHLEIGTNWQPAEVLAHFHVEAVLGWICQPEGEPVVECREICDLRCYRTAKELSAEKRETAIRELMDIAQVDCRVTAARLVDAGFKREVV